MTGGGEGETTHWAAVFADQDTPCDRVWTATGTLKASGLANADAVIRNFMVANQVRAAQLALVKNGVLKHAQGFTWAGSGFPTIQLSDRFLLASNSKMFSEAAMSFIYNNNFVVDGAVVMRNTKVYPLLGFSNPKDKRADTVTLQQLLDHEGGYDSTVSNFDLNYKVRQIALAQGLTSAVTKLDIAKYMYSQMNLDYDPGMAGAGCATGCARRYSNYGYILASLAVEKISGRSFYQFLKDYILDPESNTEVEDWPTRGPVGRPGTNEVPQADENTGLTALDPSANKRIAAVYGGDGTVKEASGGAVGLAASAEALTRFISRHAVWGDGGRTNAARKGGTPGAQSYASSCSDGRDWAINFNFWQYPAASFNQFITDLENAIGAASL